MKKSPFRQALQRAALIVVPLPAAILIKGLHRSLRIRSVGREVPLSLKGAGGQYVMAFWHGTLLLMVYAYVGEKLTFLVSLHRDGELITRVMKYFGPLPTRGSSTRGGIGALHGLLRRAKGGFDVAFTPDGPRGPARKAQEGVVQLARLSGLPIVPVGMAARHKTVLGSWDGFVVPWPFTRLAFAYGEPVMVPRELDQESLESLRFQVEVGLESAMKRAQEALDEEALWRA